MKIVQVHNYYQQAGGEDIVVAEEKTLLEQHGHSVIPYYKYNDEINQYSLLDKLNLFSSLDFNRASYKACIQFLKLHKPDICHVHNTQHIISSAIFKACKKLNIPVVQTLHNYRSICVNGMLTKNDKPCTKCLGKSSYQAIRFKCYRNSFVQTFAMARMLEKNKKNGLYQKDIDAFICFTPFAREIFIQQGLPAEKIHLKPNFVDPLPDSNLPNDTYLVFVGRLNKTKGAHLLKEIATKIRIPIYVIGRGPLEKELTATKNIKLLGQLNRSKTLAYIKGAKGLLQASVVYEGMPLTILEAFALKTPVIASDLGAMSTMIQSGKNGLLFKPNSSEDAITKIELFLQNDDLQMTLAQGAYASFQEVYSPEVNYSKLLAIYNSVVAI